MLCIVMFHRAVAFHDFKLSAEYPLTSVMKVKSSSQVMTPGVLSVVSVYPGQVHLGNAPSSLHISTHMSCNLFCTATRSFRSSVMQALLACTALMPRALCWSADIAVFALCVSLPQ